MVALPLSKLPSPELPPALPASPADAVLGTEGGDSQSPDSTELETWLGEMISTEEGLRSGGASWLEGATKLNHWTTAPGVGVGEGPASIHMEGLSRYFPQESSRCLRCLLHGDPTAWVSGFGSPLKMVVRKAYASRVASAAVTAREGYDAESERRVRRPELLGVGQGPRSGVASAVVAHSSASSAEGVERTPSSSSSECFAYCLHVAVPRIRPSSLRFGAWLLVERWSRGGPSPRTSVRSNVARSALRLTTSLPSKPVRHAVLEGSEACWRILT